MIYKIIRAQFHTIPTTKFYGPIFPSDSQRSSQKALGTKFIYVFCLFAFHQNIPPFWFLVAAGIEPGTSESQAFKLFCITMMLSQLPL